MLYDLHTHTGRYSTDSHLDIDDLLDRAAALGLDGVAVTDHYEPDYPDPRFATRFDIPEYLSHLRAKDRSAAGGPRVLRGIEFGYLPHHASLLDETARSGGFDVVIASVHVLGTKDPYFDRSVYDIGRTGAYGGFLENMVGLLRSGASFDVLGHYDYVTRYAPYEGRRFAYRDAPDLFDEVFRLLVSTGRSLELNTRTGYRLQDDGVVDWLPDPDILRRYREFGGERVSLGSDAHQVATVGKVFPEYVEFLHGLGFPGVTVFLDREPVLLPF